MARLALSVSAVSFIACNLLAFFSAHEMGAFLAGHRSDWRRWLVTSSCYVLIAQSTVFVCGLAGLLSTLPVLLALTATALLARALNLRAKKTPALPRPTPEPTPAPAEASKFTWIAYALFYGVCALRIVQAGFEETTFHWDDLSYHGSEVAHWLASGRIEYTSFSYQTYFPFSSHLLLAWFMLPFGNDSFSTLTGLVWLGLAVASLHSICRDSDSPPWVSAFVVAIFLASPPIWNMATSFVAVDVSTPALVLAAMALAYPSANRSERDITVDFAISSLLVGVAVGSRSTSAIPALVVLSLWLLESRRPNWSFTAPVVIVVFAGLASLTGAYWYLHNWITTGNPLFPAEFGPFDGPFDRIARAQTQGWPHILRGEFGIGPLLKFWAWPALTGGIACIGYISAGSGLTLRRSDPTSARQFDFALLTTAALTLVMNPFVPFSGGMNRPDSPFQLKQRFVVLALLCGLVLYRQLLSGHGRWSKAWLVLGAFAVAESLLELPSTRLAMVMGLGVMGLALHVVLPSLIARMGRPLPMRSIACALPLIVLALWQPVKARSSSETLYSYGAPKRPVGKAWERLESLPPGSRITFFSSDPSEYTLHYPLFGRALEYQAIAVDSAGVQLGLLHRRDTSKGVSWWHDWEETTDGWRARPPETSPNVLLSKLRAASVEYVLVSRWRANSPHPRVPIKIWPPQQDLLGRGVGATEIYNDGFSALWDIRLD